MILSKRSQSLKPPATLKITALAESLKREGKDVIVLAAGQPDFPTPDPIKAAGKEAIDKNITKYTPVAGMPELKKAIQQKFKRDNNLDYELNEITSGTGGKQVLFNAIHALVDYGDEVIIPVPYWVSYPAMVELAGGTPVFLETTMEENFVINPTQLKKIITPKTKAIFVNSPNNPTGSVVSKDILVKIGNICLEHGIAILSDDIYEYLIFDDMQFNTIAALNPEFKNITITINGLSKAYAMTGWRLGYAGGPKDVITAMTDYQGHCTSNTSSITQYAGVKALSIKRSELAYMTEKFEERRNISYDRLSTMPKIKTTKPQGAFYIFPDVSAYYGKRYKDFIIKDSISLCQYMLEEMLISPVPGVEFGNDNCIRISYALSTEDLIRALDRFEEGLAKLK